MTTTTTDGTVHPFPTSHRDPRPGEAAPLSMDAAPTSPATANGPEMPPEMPPELRPIRPNAQLSRSQILDATEECLIRKGYDGTTIRGIAAILGCAVGSIYRYFTDKRQLLDAVTQRRFRPVLEHVRARQKPHRTAMLYLQVATDQPQLYRLMFWLPSIEDRQNAAALPTIVQQIIDGWATQLGSIDAAEAFWCRLHGGLMLDKDIHELLETATGNRPAAAPAASATHPGADAEAGTDAEASGAVAAGSRAEDVTLL